MYVLVLEGNRELVSRLPAALACGLIRRGCSPANLVKRAPCYGRAAGVARSRRRQASTAGKASGPGDQARPRGLKPRGAAAAAARCVPSRRQRSSRAAGDRSLSGAGDQAGGCSGLQGGDPRGGTGWYLHLGPAPVCSSVDAASVPSSSLKPRKSRVFSTSWNTSSARPITLAAQQRITEETKGCSLLEHTRTTTACLGHSALLLFLLLKIAGLLASTVDSARSRFGYRSNSC